MVRFNNGEAALSSPKLDQPSPITNQSNLILHTGVLFIFNQPNLTIFYTCLFGKSQLRNALNAEIKSHS